VRSKGPATAHLILSGTAGLAGPLQVGGIECGLPGLNGSSIILVARPAATGVTLRIIILSKAVLIAVGTGSGTSYKSRTFVGAGIASFDATAGADVKSALIEANPTGSPTKSVGSATTISGTVNCGNQQPGHTTITVTGQTSSGLLTGRSLHPVRVTCTALPTGDDVNVVGLTHAGSSAVLVDIDVRTTAVNVTISAKGEPAQAFSSTSVTASATAAGADVDGAVSAAGSSQSLHVAGSATCGK
jgi:hypothetical protein